jgi:hypothetical protein
MKPATVAVAVLLAIAACGGPNDRSAASGSTEVGADQPGGSPTFTTGSTRPDTTIQQTTTSSGPSTSRFAVVVALDGALGWFDGRSWVQAQNSIPIQGGETFQVFAVGRQPAEAVAIDTNDGCELIQPSVGVALDPNPFASGLEIFGSNPLAISAPWDVAPHGVFPIKSSPEHVQLASELLSDIGVDDPEPRFAQLLRTDMDGDGVDEIFAVAERRSDPSGALFDAPTGDYSLAFARVIVGEEMRTFVLAQWVVAPPADDGFGTDLVIYRFDAFVDADDDNVDEFALRSTYYEGSGVALYDYEGPDTGFVDVISAACGA